MSPIQIRNRFLSILPFGKTTVIVLKPDSEQFIKHIRWFYSSSILFNKQSKTVNLLKKVGANEGKAKQISILPIVHSNISFPTSSSNNQSINKRQLLRQRIIHELRHYSKGFKLLFIETNTTFRILHQILNGHTLTRRERKQFIRTIVDLFEEFMQKIRSPGVRPSIEEIIKFSSLFKTELTLDDLHRPQLIALCKLLNLSFIGPTSYLRFKLHLKFHRLKLDDKLIVNEGIDNLNPKELQLACHERGMNSSDINIEHLQSQLQQWLDLHINKHIPTNILLLSQVFYSPENIRNAIRAEVIVSQTEFSTRIDIDQFRIGLEQFRHLTDTRSAKTHSNYIVQLTQSSDKRQEMY